MENTQPVYLHTDGVLRFKRNQIICDIAKNLNDIYAHIRNNHINIHIDHYRQFNQLLGYSVSGFLSLSFCYIDNDFNSNLYEYDDYYADYIDSLPVQEDPKHPRGKVLCSENYRGNDIVLVIIQLYNTDINNILADKEKYSLEDRIQFAELCSFSKQLVERIEQDG